MSLLNQKKSQKQVNKHWKKLYDTNKYKIYINVQSTFINWDKITLNKITNTGNFNIFVVKSTKYIYKKKKKIVGHNTRNEGKIYHNSIYLSNVAHIKTVRKQTEIGKIKTVSTFNGKSILLISILKWLFSSKKKYY